MRPVLTGRLPGRLFVVAAAIAAGQATGWATASAQPAGRDADIVSFRSTGRPSPELERTVAELAMGSPVDGQAGDTPDVLVRRKCGYTSPELAQRLVAGAAGNFVDGRLVAVGTVSVTAPACIVAILGSDYVVKSDDTFSGIGLDAMGFQHDGFTRRHTVPAAQRVYAEDRLVDDFCAVNASKAGVRAACDPQRGDGRALQKGVTLTLPARATSTDLKLAPPAGELEAEARRAHYAQAGQQIAVAARAVPPSAPFILLSLGQGVLRQRQKPLMGPCGAPIAPFDAQRVFDLWTAYAPSLPAVVTIVDSGLATGSPLDAFVFKPKVGGVESPADSNNADEAEKPFGSYRAFEACDDKADDPEHCPLAADLVGYHGTHVAGIALGGRDFIARLDPNAASRPLSLRIFRGLTKVPGDVVYAHTTEALTKGFNWAQSLPASPAIIVNFSVGISQGISGFTEDLVKTKGLLFVSAAGNDRKELQRSSDDPLEVVYPALSGGRASKFFVTVGNAYLDGTPHRDSNWSKEYVDLFAPGTCQESFDYGGRTRIESGTSQAAPLVSFTAALLRTIDASFATAGAIKNRIVDSADFSAKLAELSWSGGLLNVVQAIDIRADYVTYLDPAKSPLPIAARGILLDDNPAICDGRRPGALSRFHRVGSRTARYRTRESSQNSTFVLDECDIASDPDKAIRLRTYTRSKSEVITIPLAQVRSIVGRYIVPVNEPFMRRTSVDP